mmetsp:Transcript_43344/g.69456  ORF Transcript_43344/g.69456 Transcript_43344/m.69456 type:complete len:153 (-) Transcript_43344:75-533(-)
MISLSFLFAICLMQSATGYSKQCDVSVKQVTGEMLNIDGPNGVIDPYAVVYADDNEVCETGTDFNDVNPEWGDECYVGDPDYVRFEVWDQDPGDDDYMSTTRPIPTSSWKCDSGWVGPLEASLTSEDLGDTKYRGGKDDEYDILHYYYKCTC